MPTSNQFRLPHVHLLSWKSARLVVALEKMADSHAEYVRDGEPFSKAEQPSVGSLKSIEGIEWGPGMTGGCLCA
jgi:hypothetical protein